MDIIKRNPYRVLGLLGNSSERELQKQIGIIKRYAEVGKSKTFDFDLSFIGDVPRSIDDIQQASSKIEQAQNKFLYSLFWFVNHSPFDDIALNNLKDENTSKAIEVWEKTLKDNISSKNFSSYHNLSTLFLALSANDNQLGLLLLEKGIELKRRLIHSDSISLFSELVAGDRLVVDPVEISKSFVDEIIEMLTPYINKNNGITRQHLISLFNDYPSVVHKYTTSKFTDIPLTNIENKIEKTEGQRRAEPSEAEVYGETLYNSTKHDLKLIGSLLGSDNVQFQVTANKLANEILACSIDYFNEFIGNRDVLDPVEDAIKIAGFANSVGATGSVKNRIEDNISTFESWIQDEEEEKSIQVVKENIEFIVNKLSKFRDLPAYVDTTERLIVSCKPKLAMIKQEVGSQDENYLQLSSAVVGNALGALITVVNSAQENYDISRISEINSIIASALSVLNMMDSFDLTDDVRTGLITNKRTLLDISSQVRSAMQAQTKANASSGCYIATMVYGDYSHPKVMILREFRDERLLNSFFGRCFIKIYYTTSPYIVTKLRNQTRINRVIRSVLDRLIRHL